MKKFFLMTRGRTGSSAIIDELNKCEGFIVEQELFLKYDFSEAELKKGSKLILPFHYWRKEVTKSFIWKNKNLENRYLQEAERAARKSKAEVFGFKLLSHHFDEVPHLCKSLKARGYKVIYLTRNFSRQVISGMIANQRNIFNAKSEKFVISESQYYLDPIKFQELVGGAEYTTKKDLDMLMNEGFEILQINYEDFTSDRGTFYTPIFKFLQTTTKIPTHSDYKIMIKDLRKTIENYDEIVAIANEIGVPFDD